MVHFGTLIVKMIHFSGLCKKWSTFVETKERADPIPLRGVNNVKYHVRRQLYPFQKWSCLYEYFAK
jgi:hypothetical protein